MENIMKGILSKQKYLGLPPLEQEKYADKTVKWILHNSQMGITISDITTKTPFTRPTVLKHLERLISCREGYKIKRGNVFVYYPNGKAVYPENQLKVEITNKRMFKATMLQNNYGNFIFIEEDGGEGISGGGFMIKSDEFHIFMELMNKVSKRV